MSAPGSAHPHMQTDQQAHLSLGLSKVSVELHLLPSAQGRKHMFDHIDRNGNKALEEAEWDAFGTSILKKSRLSVDGRIVQLKLDKGEFEKTATVRSGNGPIRLKASARLALDVGRQHEVSFSMGYGVFSRNWHIQPYFFPDVAKANPRVTRVAGPPSTVRIVF